MKWCCGGWVGFTKDGDLMKNNRTLFPPLFGEIPSGGGGGSGQTIQVTELPEAVLSEKNKIYQYIGNTTETLTNGFFYKCVENTSYNWEETEASETYTEAEALPTASAETVGTIYKVDDKYYHTVIVLTYSWENIPVMLVEGSGGSITYSTTEQKIGKVGNDDLYAISFFNPTTSDIIPNFSKLYYFGGVAHRDGYGYFTINNGLGTALRADIRPIPNASFLITVESGVTIDIVTLHYTK